MSECQDVESAPGASFNRNRSLGLLHCLWLSLRLSASCREDTTAERAEKDTEGEVLVFDGTAEDSATFSHL